MRSVERFRQFLAAHEIVQIQRKDLTDSGMRQPKSCVLKKPNQPNLQRLQGHFALAVSSVQQILPAEGQMEGGGFFPAVDQSQLSLASAA